MPIERVLSWPPLTITGSTRLPSEAAVLLKLNETEALRDVVAFDSELPGGSHKRALEIVNSTDTEYMKYVTEILH